MIRSTVVAIICVIASLPQSARSAEEGGHHLPHNHIAIIAGRAYERASDGHSEEGNMLGIEWEHQFSEHWGIGLVFEQEAFGENEDAKRSAILAIPVSYHINESWRAFAAVGTEFREGDDSNEPLLRIGTGYDFHIGEHFTLAPEFQIDFLPSGDRVYVAALAFGYGF